MNTKDKWEISKGDDGAVIYNEYGTIAKIPISLINWEVNAHLIFAALDLLEACQDLLGDTFLEQDPNSDWFICSWCGRELEANKEGQPIPCSSDDCPSYKAKAAIAKAKP